MPKYHYNPKTGESGICRAKYWCPVCDEQHHFNTKEKLNQYIDGLSCDFTLYDKLGGYSYHYLVGARDRLLESIEESGYRLTFDDIDVISSTPRDDVEYFRSELDKENLTEAEKEAIGEIYREEIWNTLQGESFPIDKLANLYPKDNMVPQNVQDSIHKVADKVNKVNADIKNYNAVAEELYGIEMGGPEGRRTE